MIELNTLISIFVFIIGACIGSFLNVVALRGLSGESIVFPPSKCPKCGSRLKWYTNIPVVSYLFLRGKCLWCKKPISIQYPVVELLNAVLWLFCFLSFGYTIKTLFMLPLISLLIVIAVTDLKESAVLDIHTYIIIALGVLYSLLPAGGITFLQSLGGILAGFLIFECLARAGYIFAGSRAFGEGDTLIAMGIGAFFGWKMLCVIIFMSMVMQAFLTIPMLLNKSLKNKDYKGAAAYSTLILCVIAVYLFKKFNLYESMFILVLLLCVCVLLIAALIIILKDIKKKKENDDFLYLPFGPALVITTILAIFYAPQVLGFIKNIFMIEG